MNSIMIIRPYKYNKQWVFDDEKAGLIREPFVAGEDTILDHMTADLVNPEEGFNLIFSAQPFPGFKAVIEWRREEADGNWYYCDALGIEGWLCPALFKYFEKAPDKIYFDVK